MDVRNLRYFASVVENKQFTRAAKELHISQPSLSNAIKLLEKEMELKLFERSTKGLVLSEPGQILYKHAVEILNHFDYIKKEMADVKNIGAGIINVGMIESYRYLIAPLIYQFKKVYPSIRIKIREMGPEEIEHSLKNYDIHIGITSTLKENNDCTYIPLFKEKYVLITPSNHRFKNLKNINIADLKDEMFVSSLEGFEVRNTFNLACKNAGFTPIFEYETESLETARNLVEMGLGISVVPNNFITSSQTKNINIINLDDFLSVRTVYFIYQTQRYISPAINKFMEMGVEYSKKSTPII